MREELGLPQDQYTFTALMGAAGRARCAATVQQAFQDACAAGFCTTFICNTTMDNFARANHPEV